MAGNDEHIGEAVARLFTDDCHVDVEWSAEMRRWQVVDVEVSSRRPLSTWRMKRVAKQRAGTHAAANDLDVVVRRRNGEVQEILRKSVWS